MRKISTVKLKGTYRGEPVALRIVHQRTAHGPVPNWTLHVGNRSVVIDEQNMPGQITRALPAAYGTKDRVEEWTPFIHQCERFCIL